MQTLAPASRQLRRRPPSWRPSCSPSWLRPPTPPGTRASALTVPEYRATCLSMTAAVNATATVALALPIGPRVAAAADRTLRGEMGDAEFGDYTAALLIATAVG